MNDYEFVNLWVKVQRLGLDEGDRLKRYNAEVAPFADIWHKAAQEAHQKAPLGRYDLYVEHSQYSWNEYAMKLCELIRKHFPEVND